MKRVFYLSMVILIGVYAFISCENKTENEAIASENLELSSPKGKVLAKNKASLREFIVNDLKDESKIDDITVEKVSYFEDEISSFGMVNYTNKGELTSMLVLLELDENYSIFSDKNNVFIKKNKKTTKVSSKKNAFVMNRKASSKRNSIVYHCRGKNCCKWSKPNSNHMHCGCDDQSALVITTGEGCEVHIR